MSSTSKKIVILILILTVLVASAAVYISIELNKENDVGPTITPAASDEIVGAEIANFDKAWNWQDFNAKWEEIKEDNTKGWEEYVKYALTDGARYKCDEEIMTVGEEKLFGCDLNALFVIYDFEKYIEPNSITAQDSRLNAVLDVLITNSSYIQKGIQDKSVEADPGFYNSTDKDQFKRFELLNSLRAQYQDKLVKKVDFEVISIYFRNEIDPEIPLEEAKEAAKTKMDILYEKLKANEITMEEAGKEIAADKIEGDTTNVSLSKLDPRLIFKENSYAYGRDYEFGQKIFNDEVYDDELRSLGEGQMSTVRTCKDYVFTQDDFEAAKGDYTKFPFEDSCYMIFKVVKIKMGEVDTSKQLEGKVRQEFKP